MDHVHAAIDYTPAVRQTAGIGRYTRGLVQALSEVDRENSYTLLTLGAPMESAGWPPNFAFRSSRLSEPRLSLLWHRLNVPYPAERLTGPCDLFHSPDFTLPPLSRARGVVTVHDLSFLRVPECSAPALRRYLERVVPRSVARAHRVLADSTNTKEDLVALLGTPPEKVSVVPAGVESRFEPIGEASHFADRDRLEAVRARYNLPEHFILSVGTLEPRKNYPTLVSAYAALRRRGLPQRLVIAGREGWMFDPIYARVKAEGIESDVLFLGYIADADLPAVYSLAGLMAYPSLYEGFGIPPLEAMACGVPVVCSNTSSLPETVGDAALMVDPHDTEALAEAMERVLMDAGLRARMIAAGRPQAAKFTWTAAAERLVEAYVDALA